MKTVLIGALVCVSFITKAQVIVDDVDINKEDIQYLEVVAIGKFLSTKVNIFIDYGQEMTLSESSKQFIKDQYGKKITFNTPMQAINYLNKNGWEYKDNYFITSSGGNVLHFLMKKE